MITRYGRIKLSIWALMALVGFFVVGCGRQQKSNPTLQTKPAETAVPVAVAPVKRAIMAQFAPVTGTIRAVREAGITAQISARVNEVRVREGDSVTSGQVLIVLDRAEFESQKNQSLAAVRATEAQLGAARRRLEIVEEGARLEERAIARSRLEQAEAALQLAEADRERKKALYQKGAVSKQDLDATQTNYETARTNADAARHTLEMTEKGARPEEKEAARKDTQAAEALWQQAKAALARADELLSYTVIRSPLGGVVFERHIEPGEIAAPMSQIPLLKIADPKTLYYEATVPGRLSAQVHAGQSVRITARVNSDLILQGRVERLVPVADPSSRDFLVRVSIPVTSGALKPGMYAEGSIVLQERRDTLVAPKDAIVERGGRSVAFVLKNDRVEERTVQIGLTDRTEVEILSGVQMGEQVVVQGAQTLKDGALVQVRGNEE